MATGTRINATLIVQPIPIACRPMVNTPASIRPAGHPACSTLSHLVLCRGYIVATTGLITASTVPLPSAPTNAAQYRLL